MWFVLLFIFLLIAYMSAGPFGALACLAIGIIGAIMFGGNSKKR